MGTRSFSDLVAHVVWAVKGRAQILAESDDGEWGRRFTRAAAELNAKVIAVGVAPDHVHVLVIFPAARSLSEVVQRMKGASSHAHNLDLTNAYLRWQQGFWARSCDPQDLSQVRTYVLTQRTHHARGREPEEWEAARHDGE